MYFTYFVIIPTYNLYLTLLNENPRLEMTSMTLAGIIISNKKASLCLKCLSLLNIEFTEEKRHTKGTVYDNKRTKHSRKIIRPQCTAFTLTTGLLR